MYPPPAVSRFAVVLALLLAFAGFSHADPPQPLLPIPHAQPIPGARANPGGPPASAPASQPVKPAFIIGVWSQPVNDIPAWKARGINTMFNFEKQGGTVSMDDYTGSCAYNGMFMVRQPNPNIKEDVTEPYLLAWMHDDEPDIRNPPTDPVLLIDGYKRMKEADPKRPVFVNFSGGNVLFKKTPRSFYDGYIKAADWIGNDFYPVTGWNHPDWLFRVGEICDILKEWSGGKPQIVFIECSDQQLAWTPKETRGVTPEEMTAEIWTAVIHGAIGIVYFPQTFEHGSGFKYDDMNPEISKEMVKQNRRLTELGPILRSCANPTGALVTVKAPMAAGWRRTSDGTLYLIVENQSNDLRKHEQIQVTGAPSKLVKDKWSEDHTLTIANNMFTDDFRPLEVKLYVISKSVK